MRGNYTNYYPPGADADLLQREREQAELDERITQIERAIRDDPEELLGYLDENEIRRRLVRMLNVCRDHRTGRTPHIEGVGAKVMQEYEAAVSEALDEARKLEGL